MQELLKFNSLGQWSLHKQVGEHADEPDNDYMSYRARSLTGQLPEDHGNRGELHNVGNKRSPKKNSDERMHGKVPTPVGSAKEDISPGLGLQQKPIKGV